MEIVIVPSSAEAGTLAAGIVSSLVDSTSDAVLGVATGSSPLPIYRELIRRHRAGSLSFATTRVFLLDEYVGLPEGHAASYRRFIETEFASLVDLPASNLFGPDGRTEGIATAGERFEGQIAEAGGIDLQILGIGRDGHIGFNEPGSSLGSRTRMKTLTMATRGDNARFFDDDIEAVPRHVITQGVATIGEARHLLVIATGEHKAAPIARMVEGPVTAMVPASALQLHPHVTVIVDEAAGSELVLHEYYREVLAHKPEWQTY